MEDAMLGLGPEVRALLDEARWGDEPTAADRERVRAAIALRVGGGAAATLGLVAGIHSAAAAPAAGVLKSVVMAALVGALATGMGAWLLLRVPHEQATLGVQESSPIASLATLPTDSQPVAPPPTAQGMASPVNAPHPGPRTTMVGPAISSTLASAPMATSGRTGDVAAEVRLLGEAQTAIRAGDAARALTLVEDHARRYPTGALGEEREATRIGALCRLGRLAEAREATDHFLRATPRSPLAGPVRASCGSR
jgi:hypothetical protein